MSKRKPENISKDRDSLNEPIPKLHYFGVPGRAEFIKLVFEDAGQKYDYIAHDFGEYQKMKDKFAFGTQLPVLEDNGFNLSQTAAIVVYLSKKFGYYPSDLQESALAEMVMCGATDYIEKFFNAYFSHSLPLEDFKNKVVPQWFGDFVRLLERNKSGSGFVVGKNITFADFYLFQVLDMTNEYIPDLINNFPSLVEFHQRIAKRPHIANFLKSDRSFPLLPIRRQL